MARSRSSTSFGQQLSRCGQIRPKLTDFGRARAQFGRMPEKTQRYPFSRLRHRIETCALQACIFRARMFQSSVSRLADIGQSWPTFGQAWPDMAQSWSKLAKWGHLGPHRTKFGRGRPKVAQIWSKLVRTKQNSVQMCSSLAPHAGQTQAKFRRHRPEVGRNLAEVGPFLVNGPFSGANPPPKFRKECLCNTM